MPSKSPAQARLMAAAAHTKGGYGGVPQKVGEEFNAADEGTGMLKGKRAKGKAQRRDGLAKHARMVAKRFGG